MGTSVEIVVADAAAVVDLAHASIVAEAASGETVDFILDAADGRFATLLILIMLLKCW
jgi:hypothetical protein